ncbi:MAG: type II secretion system F family protein [Clostridiales bacterium]|nr:type II secretion system F family protein [Clostridiales bacterium]
MIYLYLMILAVYFLLWLLSCREKEKGPFRRIASYLLYRQQRIERGKHNWKKDLCRRQLEEKLKRLQPSIAVSKQVRDYYLTQYSLVLIVVFSGDLLCLGAWVSAHSSPLLIDGSYIGRNSYGSGEVPVELSARIEGEEEEIFEYLVEERQYTEEETEALYENALEILPDAVLGDNQSLEDVWKDLELVTGLEGYPFEIAWESSSYALINTDGTVNNQELTEGEIVTLTAHFRYKQWSADEQFCVKVNPVIYTNRELLREHVKELLQIQAEKTKYDETMILPANLGDKAIVWKEIIDDGSGYLLIFIIFAAGVLYWSCGRELDQKLDRRKRELLLDYPEIVNKLALYMGAGMTIRNAFLKMSEDYRKQSNGKRKYVYEEIAMVCHELQSGRSEAEAYDHLGKRCQVQSYIKLGALLSQNIRKGSNDLLQMLRQEADNAFAERKSLAKKLGEEAGTKLLLPMMIMLCVVMVIIMIPAYFSFL